MEVDNIKFLKKLIIILFLAVSISACNTTNRAIIENFTVSMNSPQVVIGEVEIQFETLMGLGRLRKQVVPVIYFSKEDAVCLRYKYEFYTYNQFWNQKGRAGFINALKKYNEDYDARNLQQSNRRSLQKYGTVRGYLVWQQLSFTVQAFANMNVELGYIFKERSPYFSVYQRDAEYTDERARDNNRVSPNITMYFTRAQAAELAEIFEQYIIPDTNPPEEHEEPKTPPVKKNEIPKDAY